MPEGDTILRTARNLARALEGRDVTRFETVLANLARVDDDAPIAGRTVERVSSMGKNLLISLSGGLHLRTHMRMNGSWHLYKPDSKWQAPRAAMRVVIASEEWIAVAFDVPVAEFLTESQLRRHPDLSRIGPDLLDPELDEDEAVRRLRARATMTIAEAILNQRVVSGIGNEYKSEVLFLARVNPFDLTGDLSDEKLREIVSIGRSLLEANVIDPLGDRVVVYRGPRRTTRTLNEAERRWVYGRNGKPCRNCGTSVRMEKMGIDARLTFWCPGCQPSPCREPDRKGRNMKLPHGLTTQQIRVIQEFRRKAQDELTLEELNAIQHPGGGGGDAPARELVASGYLASSGEVFTMTDRARELLARPSVPLNSGEDEGAAAAE